MAGPPGTDRTGPGRRRRGVDGDAMVFYPYLYWPTSGDRPATVPTILHPAAHDEPALHLPIFPAVFDAADALVFQTEAERHLSRRASRRLHRQLLLGLGVDDPDVPVDGVVTYGADSGADLGPVPTVTWLPGDAAPGRRGGRGDAAAGPGSVGHGARVAVHRTPSPTYRSSAVWDASTTIRARTSWPPTSPATRCAVRTLASCWPVRW